VTEDMPRKPLGRGWTSCEVKAATEALADGQGGDLGKRDSVGGV